MPRPVKVSIEKGKTESEDTIQDNLSALLVLFSQLRTLYPEIAKLPSETDFLTLALDENTKQEIWIVSLNVLNIVLPDDWDYSDNSNIPAFDEPALSSRKLREQIGGSGEGGGGLPPGLKSFPAFSALPPGEATLSDADEGAVSGDTSTSSTIGLLGLPALHTFGTVPDPDATYAPGSSNQSSSSYHGQASGSALQPHDNTFDEIEESAIIPGLKIRDLPELEDIEEEDMDHDNNDISPKFGLATNKASVKEQYVIGMAFALPSTIRPPNALKPQSSGVDHTGDALLEVDSLAEQGHQLEMGIKSYDVGVLLDFALVRENIQFLTSCQQDITFDLELRLTQEAIFDILLDLEPTIIPDGAFQFQVLITMSNYESDPIEYEKILAAFLTMGFIQEPQEEVYNYQGFEEFITALTMRMDEWERYKEEVRHIPKDLNPMEKGKVDKGKGKVKDNIFGL